MSHQTGIQANKELQRVFHECNSGRYRAIKISIEKEELCCSGKIASGRNSWEQDYDSTMNNFVEKDVPCYILYRFDEKMTYGYAWLLFTWIPDVANVRNKMMYASTKATLKTNFGTTCIKEEIHATSLSEVNIKEYFKSKQESSSFCEENEAERFARLKVTNEVSSNAVKTFGGLDFPITETATRAIKDFAQNRFNYIRFYIDVQQEFIDIAVAKNVKVDSLHNEILNDIPGYHIYFYEHFHEDELKKSIIFIYSTPLAVTSIKQKMVYSSCKSAFVDRLLQHNISINKKVEVDDPLEVNEKLFLDELYPRSLAPRIQFAKPKGPPGRGAKRFTKVND